MSLLAPFDRPVALRELGLSRPAAAAPPVLPSLAEVPEPLRRALRRRTRAEIARFLTDVLLSETRTVRDAVPELEANVVEQVEVWSPSLCAHSRTELVAALLDSDDAITDTVVAIIGETTSGSAVIVEWHLTGRFTNAGFVNDDLLIEPSGREVVATGVVVFEFLGDRATHIRCYYDALGLLEQVVGPEGG